MKLRRVVIRDRNLIIFTIMTLMALCLIVFHSSESYAATAREINVSADVTLKNFYKNVKGAKEYLKSAKGVLVFPSVYKAGFGIGGEYGEGALRIGGKTIEYYSTVAGSFGFQLGAQKKTLILVFTKKEALKSFRESNGWKAGVDGSVALVTVGIGGSIDTTNIKDPIVAFAFDQKGLMYNLTIEGSKFSKIKK
ncbi:MAG: YSC84-related protein [Desulfobacteraceae bacterium]|nr:YSC84-related protein [Desulfobacteraceae bacterium]